MKEFTQRELTYLFNCVSVHGNAVDLALESIKDKVSKKPSTFFKVASELGEMLDDLISGYEIQLKILPKMSLVHNEKHIKKTLGSGLKDCINQKSNLNKILDKLDEHVGE